MVECRRIDRCFDLVSGLGLEDCSHSLPVYDEGRRGARVSDDATAISMPSAYVSEHGLHRCGSSALALCSARGG